MLESVFKGWLGELKTKAAEWLLLDPEVYHAFNNVLVLANGRTTQIDHVIVSKYGVFVLETKDKTGWILGDGKQREWTQVIYRGRHRFQNPLRQNYLHTKTVSELLGVPHNKLHSLVVFWGDCEFKTRMPDNVVHGVLAPASYIKGKRDVLLSDLEVDSICEKLAAIQGVTTSAERRNHKREVKQRFHGNACPRCGGKLRLRSVERGPKAGEKFLGCSNYPRCRYTRELD